MVLNVHKYMSIKIHTHAPVVALIRGVLFLWQQVAARKVGVVFVEVKQYCDEASTWMLCPPLCYLGKSMSQLRTAGSLKFVVRTRKNYEWELGGA